jgi:carboxyl-terminal processing protease
MENKEQKPNNSPNTIKIPTVIGLSLAAGLLIGATFFGGNTRLGSIIKNYNKYKEVLTLIEASYVDSVDTDSLVDFSIKKMLEKLDPHTAYFSSAEATMAKAPLEAGFDGIGVEFNTFKDTVVVITALAGGPSESAGIQSGDMIIKADSTSLTGPKLTNNLIFSKLRGKRGSEVKLSIKRKGTKDLLVFNIKRDRIPSFSVSAGYLIDPKTGYIKVDRFSESTTREFQTTVDDLKKAGMKQLVLDLRGNGGGYMDRATSMVDDFVAGQKLIVYTDGKGTQYDQKTFCNKTGNFEDGALIVLVDEGSASASEIVSGSLQDNDRALIVGRRSFGKGLVQRPVSLSDGSELRLTISRYYIPSGRSIQKPYVLGGEDDEYDNDYKNRLKSGEFFNADSVKNNKKLAYKTVSGRTVYGGGGITPDIFVAKDTSFYSQFLYDVWGNGILRNYALNYVNNNKKELSKYTFTAFKNNFTVTDKMYNDIIEMAKADGIKIKEKDTAISKSYILLQAKAYMARNIWQKKTKDNGFNNEYFQIMATNDAVLKKALTNFDKAEVLVKNIK